ncbi:MAG TPA: hypothetical protein VIU12_25580 [Chryseolinea sp.]
MSRNNIALIVIGVIGGIFLIVLVVKLILALINSTLLLSSFVISVLGFVFNILAVLVAILAVIGVFILMLAAFSGIINQMKLLMKKIDSVVSESLEKLMPILIATVSQIFLILVSRDYAPSSTKAFLSVMLWVLVGIILVSQARPEMKKWPAILASVAVLAIILLFISMKYSDYSFYGFINLQWNALLAMHMIDMFSILFVCLGLLILFIVFLYYHFRRKAMS